MAETGAHLSATYLKKPSVFELIAQDSLANTFHPALKRVALYLSTQNPSRYGWLVPRYEECFLLFNLLLQRHYLKNFGATFSENFYNLQRIVTTNENRDNVRLPVKQEMLSLLFATFYPYIRNKLQALAEKYENEDWDCNQDIPKWRKELIMSLHRIMHLSMESISMFLYIGYMTGRLERHSLFLWLADVRLTYQREDSENSLCWKSIWNDIRTGNVRSLMAISPFKRTFSFALELSAFFIQFLNWWHSKHLFSKLNACPIPHAPNDEQAMQSSGLCPICENKIQIESALSVSGYVFCYKCIRAELLRYKKCPITGIPATENELIRLYPDNL